MKIDLQRLLPNRPEDTQVQLIEAGGHPALIVDNFYRDPDHLRELALTLNYRVPPAMHPGYRAALGLSLEPVVSAVFERFAKGYFPTPESMEAHATAWQFFNSERRPGDPPRPMSQRPHVDTGLLVGLVYLNKPEHCRGGTAFYRHQTTGAEAVFPKKVHEGRNLDGKPIVPALRTRMWEHRAALDYERALQAGLASSYGDYCKRIADTPGDETGNIIGTCGGWQLMQVVEMKYNRLVMFPGFVMHSTHFLPEWFGNTPQTWRLTHNFMFDWPAA